MWQLLHCISFHVVLAMKFLTLQDDTIASDEAGISAQPGEIILSGT